MKSLIRAYRFLNVLSIDVAVGAVIGAMFFAKIFNVPLLPYGLISLGLTVWIIYTADHLIDALKVKQIASSERHRFHQKYFKILFAALIVGVVTDTVQLFFIRKIVFLEGLGLAIVILIYFLIQRSLKFLKEVTGAILYSGGVLLIPMSVNTEALTNTQMILITQFALTALINLFLFSLFDKEQDERDQHSSFATIMGEKATRASLIILFLIQITLSSALLLLAMEKSAIVLIAMNVVLFLIFFRRNYFQINDRYRLLGDAVFLFPILYVLV
jgi:hypothetical protein